MVFVDKLTARHLGLLFLRTRIDVNLRARTAWACVAHLPEVVVLVATDDVVLGQLLLPDASSLIVARQTLFRAAFEDGSIEVFRINLQHINNVLPCP